MKFTQASYEIIADLLAERTGQELTDNRKWRLSSALSGLFRQYGISNLDQLVCLLTTSSSGDQADDLAQEVVEALLNNETYFFRDKPTFDQIPQQLLPELRERRAHLRRLSIWCAGCSTGQEVHSLGMLFDDQKDMWSGWRIEILGTDISPQVINTARSGVYSQFDIQRGLGVADMLRHFDETSKGWKLRKNAQLFSRFEQHNLLSPPPIKGRFDLILCRNVLLYFDAEKRALAFRRLASALADDGYVMLGNGETPSAQTDTLIASNGRVSIFEPATMRHKTQEKPASS